MASAFETWAIDNIPAYAGASPEAQSRFLDIGSRNASKLGANALRAAQQDVSTGTKIGKAVYRGWTDAAHGLASLFGDTGGAEDLAASYKEASNPMYQATIPEANAGLGSQIAYGAKNIGLGLSEMALDPAFYATIPVGGTVAKLGAMALAKTGLLRGATAMPSALSTVTRTLEGGVPTADITANVLPTVSRGTAIGRNALLGGMAGAAENTAYDAIRNQYTLGEQRDLGDSALFGAGLGGAVGAIGGAINPKLGLPSTVYDASAAKIPEFTPQGQALKDTIDAERNQFFSTEPVQYQNPKSAKAFDFERNLVENGADPIEAQIFRINRTTDGGYNQATDNFLKTPEGIQYRKDQILELNAKVKDELAPLGQTKAKSDKKINPLTVQNVTDEDLLRIKTDLEDALNAGNKTAAKNLVNEFNSVRASKIEDINNRIFGTKIVDDTEVPRTTREYVDEAIRNKMQEVDAKYKDMYTGNQEPNAMDTQTSPTDIQQPVEQQTLPDTTPKQADNALEIQQLTEAQTPKQPEPAPQIQQQEPAVQQKDIFPQKTAEAPMQLSEKEQLLSTPLKTRFGKDVTYADVKSGAVKINELDKPSIKQVRGEKDVSRGLNDYYAYLENQQIQASKATMQPTPEQIAETNVELANSDIAKQNEIFAQESIVNKEVSSKDVIGICE